MPRFFILYTSVDLVDFGDGGHGGFRKATRHMCSLPLPLSLPPPPPPLSLTLSLFPFSPFLDRSLLIRNNDFSRICAS